MNSQRRKILKAAAATAIAAPAAKAAAGKSKTSEPQKDAPTKKVHYKGGKKPERKPGDQPPLLSGAVSYGNLLFIAGKGAHFEGDIKAHTKHVLDEIEKELVNAGSSMEKGFEVQRLPERPEGLSGDERGLSRAFRRGATGPHDDRRRRRHPRQFAGRD